MTFKIGENDSALIDHSKMKVGQGFGNWESLQIQKKFLWKACLGILPTKVNLRKRKIFSDQTCPLCLVKPETTKHILWDYISTSDILEQCTRRIQKSKDSCNIFKSLIEDMFSNLEIEEMEELTLIL